MTTKRDGEIESQLFGKFELDPEYELFLKAWIAYHEAADLIDGHLPPGHPDQRALGPLAVRAGKEAMSRYVPQEVVFNIMKSNDYETYNKWQRAKLEAVRRLTPTTPEGG